MPASSKSQQRLMGMVHAYQKGELKTKDMNKSLVDKIKKMSKQMKTKTVKDFAETTHDNLPQKVETKINKFEDFLLEYNFKFKRNKKTNDQKIDSTKLVNTINSESDPKILDDLFQILYTRRKHQENVEKHYKDDENMLKFPYEIVKERDLNTIDILMGMLKLRLDKIKSDPTKKEKREPKTKKIGYGIRDEKPEPIPPESDIKTAYKRSELGYKFRHMESFVNFFVNETKMKDPKKEILKHLSKKKREERLESGANLSTKVVPDKKKQYTRKKKVNLEED